jgi:hypothetical protein
MQTILVQEQRDTKTGCGNPAEDRNFAAAELAEPVRHTSETPADVCSATETSVKKNVELACLRKEDDATFPDQTFQQHSAHIWLRSRAV